MKKKKALYTTFIALILLGGTQTVNGQFLKKLKKKVEQKLEQKADEEADKLLNGQDNTATYDNGKPQNTANKKNPEKTPKNQRNTPTTGSSSHFQKTYLTFKSPSENFSDVVIPSHNNLPRFGALNPYSELTPVSNHKGYKALVELKYLSEVYKNMNRTNLTQNNRNTSQQVNLKAKHSTFAQRHLLNTIGQVGTEELLLEYTCNPKLKENCKAIGIKGERLQPAVWGGDTQNKFQQKRQYTSFIQLHFETLQNWADTFFKDGYEIAYYVDRGSIRRTYDFKNKGYWLYSLMNSTISDFMLHRSNFLAYTEGEQQVKFASKLIFLPLAPEKAKELKLEERLIQNTIPIHTVFKVRVSPKTLNSDKTNIQFEFQLESQTVELYKDRALTKKIGELDLTNLTTKNEE